ncbi:hypothetical protein [Corynebacterium capitovis]|nr:hypothetical protein [Corynebacterium capitovis]
MARASLVEDAPIYSYDGKHRSHLHVVAGHPLDDADRAPWLTAVERQV